MNSWIMYIMSVHNAIIKHTEIGIWLIIIWENRHLIAKLQLYITITMYYNTIQILANQHQAFGQIQIYIINIAIYTCIYTFDWILTIKNKHYSYIFLGIPSKSRFCVTCCKQRWHLGITSPSSVCPSVRLSVRTSHFLSRHTFYPVTLFLSKCNNSSSTDAIEMKLHMWIERKRVKSQTQDP